MGQRSPLGRIIHRYVTARRKFESHLARGYTRSHLPVLLAAYSEFDSLGQSGTPRQPFKGYDLWRILERFRPKHVVELGSGTTSAVFAHFAFTHEALYTCFEHSGEWANVTRRCLRTVGLVTTADPVRIVDMVTASGNQSTGFAEPIPADADFIYLDGPPCLTVDGHKRPNNDVFRLLDRGCMPRCIVVDGRTETVDYILSHPAASGYAIEPSYVYAVRHGLWTEALRGREHTILHHTG